MLHAISIFVLKTQKQFKTHIQEALLLLKRELYNQNFHSLTDIFSHEIRINIPQDSNHLEIHGWLIDIHYFGVVLRTFISTQFTDYSRCFQRREYVKIHRGVLFS